MLVFLGIGRKGHRDHVYKRNDVKDENAKARQRHQGDMKVSVKQCRDVFFETAHMFAPLDHLLKLIGMTHLQNPEHNDRRNDKQRNDPGKQDLLGVIAHSVLIDLLGFIPDLALRFGA